MLTSKGLIATAVGRRRLLVMAAALAVAPALAAAPAFGEEQTIHIGVQKYGTLIVLQVRGELEKRLAPLGVTVKWTEFPGGPQLLEGLGRGQHRFRHHR